MSYQQAQAYLEEELRANTMLLHDAEETIADRKPETSAIDRFLMGKDDGNLKRRQEMLAAWQEAATPATPERLTRAQNLINRCLKLTQGQQIRSIDISPTLKIDLITLDLYPRDGYFELDNEAENIYQYFTIDVSYFWRNPVLEADQIRIETTEMFLTRHLYSGELEEAEDIYNQMRENGVTEEAASKAIQEALNTGVNLSELKIQTRPETQIDAKPTRLKLPQPRNTLNMPTQTHNNNQ